MYRYKDKKLLNIFLWNFTFHNVVTSSYGKINHFVSLSTMKGGVSRFLRYVGLQLFGMWEVRVRVRVI